MKRLQKNPKSRPHVAYYGNVRVDRFPRKKTITLDSYGQKMAGVARRINRFAVDHGMSMQVLRIDRKWKLSYIMPGGMQNTKPFIDGMTLKVVREK